MGFAAVSKMKGNPIPSRVKDLLTLCPLLPDEASVCKECILREMPCTHRMCELSPESRSGCDRAVCFYVHKDWMPDICESTEGHKA